MDKRTLAIVFYIVFIVFILCFLRINNRFQVGFEHDEIWLNKTSENRENIRRLNSRVDSLQKLIEELK